LYNFNLNINKEKEELIKPFLEHLVLLKVRISVSLSLAKS